MKRTIYYFLSLLLMLLINPVCADTLTADGFSARMITTIQGQTSVAEIKGTSEMLYMQILGGRTFSTMIARFDRNVLWLLAPVGRQYREMPLDAMGKSVPHFFLKDLQMKKTRIGEEVLNSIPAIKYEAIVTGPNNQIYSGILWEGKEDMPLPLKWQDPANNLEVTWENVTCQTFPLNLFLPPVGYVKVMHPEVKAAGDLHRSRQREKK